MNADIHIALTDDHPLMLQGISRFLEATPGIKLVGSYGSGQDLLEGLKQAEPDILLLDLNLPDYSGNDLIRILRKTWPDIRVLVLTSIDSLFQVRDMMQRGCSGYLLKSSSPETVLQAIHTIYQGGEFIEPVLKEQLLRDTLGKKNSNQLTKREREILSMICDGETNTTIAAKLFLSLRTIENHRFSLYQKFNVSNTAGLVKVALTQGLI